MFKVYNKNTRIRHWPRSGVFIVIVNLEDISNLFLVFLLLLTLIKQMLAYYFPLCLHGKKLNPKNNVALGRQNLQRLKINLCGNFSKSWFAVTTCYLSICVEIFHSSVGVKLLWQRSRLNSNCSKIMESTENKANIHVK